MESVVFGLVLVVAIGLLVAACLTLRRRSSRPTAPLPVLRDHEFDARVGEAFRAQGYQRIEAARSGRDAQADLLLRRDRQTFVVLTRQRNAARIGVEVLQALQRTMAVHGATGGFALTSGRFSREATAFAAGCNIRLIEGAALAALLARGAAASRLGAEPQTESAP